MKLETKIYLTFIVVLLIIGGSFFITGFSVLNLLNISAGSNRILILLLFIVISIVIAFVINHRIRKPLFFFIRWIDQLSRGVFKRPDPIKNFTLEKMKFSPFVELKSTLDGLTSQLNKAEQERTELEEVRKNWTAGVTHDLKTPLSYIKGYSTMLRTEYNWEVEEIKEFAKVIEEKSLYMEQLIDDLSIVYEFDQTQTPLDLRKLNLIAFLREVLEGLRQYPMADDYSIDLTVKNEDSIMLTFDQMLLKRALENFIMNAMNHNPSGTVIIVSVEIVEGVIIIEVKDDGIGMDDQAVQQLFNQYYRGTTTDQSHLGSGLGMSIAKQFIEKQGGWLNVESEPNKGTKIKIIFAQ